MNSKLIGLWTVSLCFNINILYKPYNHTQHPHAGGAAHTHPTLSSLPARGSGRACPQISLRCCLDSLLKQVADLADWATLPTWAVSMFWSASKEPLILMVSFLMRPPSLSVVPLDFSASEPE